MAECICNILLCKPKVYNVIFYNSMNFIRLAYGSMECIKDGWINKQQLKNVSL